MREIEYRLIEGLPGEELFLRLVQLNHQLFGFGESVENLSLFLGTQRRLLTCLALRDEVPVGFKLGFQERPHYFESWRGGVLEAERRQGIAEELLRRQHAWAKAEGFRIITTTTDNRNAGMLIVNLRNGFRIVGSFLDRGEHLKVLLQKRLDAGDEVGG